MSMALPVRRRSVGAFPTGARANDNDERVLEESLEERLDREALTTDLVDVPAAVVCLVCGEVDCAGCEDRDLSKSGIVAIVAWERPGLPALMRLWSTARSTTRDADTFFELLPDGPVLPALRFAAVSELLAVGSMLIAFLPVAALWIINVFLVEFRAYDWFDHFQKKHPGVPPGIRRERR